MGIKIPFQALVPFKIFVTIQITICSLNIAQLQLLFINWLLCPKARLAESQYSPKRKVFNCDLKNVDFQAIITQYLLAARPI